jgi:hypothetical protein
MAIVFVTQSGGHGYGLEYQLFRRYFYFTNNLFITRMKGDINSLA